MNKKQANQRVWVGKGRNSAGSHWTVQTAPQGLGLWKHKAGYWQRSCGHKKAGLKHTLGTGSSSFHTNKTQTSKKIQRSVRQVENGDDVQGRCWTPPLWLVQWFHNSDELCTCLKKNASWDQYKTLLQFVGNSPPPFLAKWCFSSTAYFIMKEALNFARPGDWTPKMYHV